ncbi:MAG: hypothetical protein AAF368_01130 [Planctomycetota bacterium]
MEGTTVIRFSLLPRAAALLLLPLLISATGGDDDLPINHASHDIYTKGGDAEAMAQAGIVSHGGYEFGESDTAKLDNLLVGTDVRWLESEHFKLGFALGAYKVKVKEKKAIFAELTDLQELYPTINPKQKVLDPWLRAHMYIQRAERLYDQFLEIVDKKPEDFPDGTTPWDTTGTYMGEGPHLGQKGKYEILMLTNETVLKNYLKTQFGLATDRSQRWNVVKRYALTATMQERQGSLRVDEAMHGHLAFHLGMNFLDGYRFYAYDAPIYLREAMAHWFERSVTENYNTFDSDEGGTEVVSKKSDWKGAVRKAVSANKAPRMAELIRLNTFSQMDLNAHFCIWSWLDFLITTRPAEFTQLIDALKGRVREDFYPDGSNLDVAHREAFKEIFGWSYAKFDQTWKDWVLENY